VHFKARTKNPSKHTRGLFGLVQAEWKSRNGSPGTVFQILLNQISAGERDANTRKGTLESPLRFSWFAQMVLENGKHWIPLDGLDKSRKAQSTKLETNYECT
jgi:hypothetical protein